MKMGRHGTGMCSLEKANREKFANQRKAYLFSVIARDGYNIDQVKKQEMETNFS